MYAIYFSDKPIMPFLSCAYDKIICEKIFKTNLQILEILCYMLYLFISLLVSTFLLTIYLKNFDEYLQIYNFLLLKFSLVYYLGDYSYIKNVKLNFINLSITEYCSKNQKMQKKILKQSFTFSE